MAEAAVDPRRRDVRQGVASRVLTRLAQLIIWLFLSLIFSVLIEWAGMLFWWPQEGAEHSRQMLVAELGYVETDVRRSVLTADPVRFASALAESTHHVLFEVTGVVDLIGWATARQVVREQGLRSTLVHLFERVGPFVVAAMQITQVFSVRLAILALSSPVFVLFSLVALVDGLVQRDIRRWGGGRESAFVYHWAKRSALPLLVFASVLYLALPFSLHPAFIVLPFATLFALSIAVTASSFKKYL